MFNADDKCWEANNTVTVDNGYTLKLINDYNAYTLYCYNTFTNYGNVIIKDNAYLDIDYNNKTNIDASNNYGTIDIINGVLGLYNRATLNNKGTITLKDSGYILISESSTLTNTGTIDISNITDLSVWYNDGTFKLEGGSTFILPKNISSKVDTFWWKNNIQLNGTKDNPVIFKYYTHEQYIDNNSIRIRPIPGAETYTSLTDIINKTGFTFTGNTSNVSFIPIDKYTLSDILTIDSGKYNDCKYTLDISQLGIIPTIDSSTISTIDTKLIIPEGYTLTVTGNIKVNSIWDVKGTTKGSKITYTKGSSSNVKGGNVRSSIRTKGGKIVFK